MESFIPRRVVSSRRSLPWLTASVRKHFYKRNEAHRVAKRLDSPASWQKFRSLRNAVVSALRRAKRSFFVSLSRKITNLKEFWKAYRIITKEDKQVPSSLSKGSVTATFASDKADLLNSHFASCFTPLSSTILPSAFPDSGECLSSVPCSSMDVLRELSTMRRNIASGPDGISSVMLRLCRGHQHPLIRSFQLII